MPFFDILILIIRILGNYFGSGNMKVLKAFKNLFIISGYLFLIILILNIDQIKSEEIKLAATVILFIFIYIFMIP